jgi:hypothetical protein
MAKSRALTLLLLPVILANAEIQLKKTLNDEFFAGFLPPSAPEK